MALPRVVRYFAGATASRLAEETAIPALLLFGLAISGSPRQAALLYAALTIAAALGGPLLASVLDRARSPHHVLAGAVLIYGLSLLATVLVGASTTLTAAAGLAVVAGLFGPMVSGGWSSQLARVSSGSTRLRRLQALDAATFNAAGLTGPVIASAVAVVAGASAAVATAAGLALVGAAIGATVRLDGARAPAQSGARLARTVFGDLRRGFGTILFQRRLRAVTIGSTVSYVGFGAVVVSVPVSARTLTGSHEAAGLFFAVIAGAALLTMVVLAHRTPRWSDTTMFVLATATMGAGMAIGGAASQWWTAVLALAIIGIGDGPQLAAVIGVRTSESSEEVRGMVFLTGASLKISAAAVGGLVGGSLAEIDASRAFWFAADAQLVALGWTAFALGRPPLTRTVE